MKIFVFTIIAAFAFIVFKAFNASVAPVLHPAEQIQQVELPARIDTPVSSMEQESSTESSADFVLSQDTPLGGQILRVGLNSNPPRKRLHEDGRVTGATSAILRSLADYLEMGLEIQVCQIKQCLEFARQGLIDAMVEVQNNPERESVLEFIEPMIEIPVSSYFFFKPSRADILDAASIAGLRIGVLSDPSSFAWKQIDIPTKKSPKILSFSNVKDALSALDKNVVDVVWASRHLVDFALSKSGSTLRHSTYKEVETVQVPLLAISKNSQLLEHRKIFSDAITQLTKNGTFAKIQNTEDQVFSQFTFAATPDTDTQQQ